MEYRHIVAVTGLPGLFQLVNTKTEGAFVRSLQDKNIKFVSARTHHITPLESIEIYTQSENVRLHQVLESMKENDAPIKGLLTDKKASNDAFRQYFGSIVPDFDVERVYVSDIKKILKWYEILKANELLDFEAYKQSEQENAEEATEETLAEATGEPNEKPKAKKATAKKAEVSEGKAEEPATKSVKKAAKKSVKAEDEENAEKPAKKAAAKKATKRSDGEEAAKPAKKAAKKKDAE